MSVIEWGDFAIKETKVFAFIIATRNNSSMCTAYNFWRIYVSTGQHVHMYFEDMLNLEFEANFVKFSDWPAKN